MGFARSHWVWLSAILSVYSVWDWYDHISRPGSAFEQAPGAWFGFTFASCASVLLIAWGCAKLLERARSPELIASALGIAVAVLVHLRLTGPLWDHLFWDGGLYFHEVAVPMGIAVGLYLVFRLVFAGVLRLVGQNAIVRP